MTGRYAAADPVLFLSPEAPYPLAGGGALRSACLLEYFAARAPIHLVVFAEAGRPDPRQALPAGLVEHCDVVRLPYHRRDWLSRAARNLGRLARGRPPLTDRFCRSRSLREVAEALEGRRFSIGVVEHFWCAEYHDVIAPCADTTVLDLHNIESALHQSCALSEPFPQDLAHRRFGRHARRAERELLPRFDIALTTSEADAERVREIAPSATLAAVPNCIPFRAPLEEPEREMIAFSGNFDYHPNVSAVRFFAGRVWPVLRNKYPDLTWRLIGKNEAHFRHLAAADPRIELSGPVEDALAELARARVVVAPLLSGSGTRVKIIEAWAASRAVVSTPIGAEGLPVREETNLLLADGPERWLQQVSRLLEDRLLRRRLGAQARATYEEQCCWPAAWRSLDAAFAPLWRPAQTQTIA